MARKTKEEAQATREGILDAAQVCFHEYGVAGTSLAISVHVVVLGALMFPMNWQPPATGSCPAISSMCSST